MTPPVEPVAGLLLTGGLSRRLGQDKAALIVFGERLADRASRVLSAVADPVLEVGPGYGSLPSVREGPPGAGPLAAVVAGCSELRRRGHAGPVVILAVDMPLVDAPLLRLLAERPEAESIVPVADGRDQPLCARYAAVALDVAERLVADGERSMRALLAAVPVTRLDASAWGDVAPPDAFADVDTPEDLARLLARG